MNMMKKYKIVVAYEGTEYFGWQQQKNLPTIAGTLEKSFFSVFGKKISLLGASRTDAGVHALCQVAQFNTDLVISPQRMLQAWNNRLPSDIVINQLEEVPLTFHIHAAVERKTYRYHFFLERPLPLSQRFGWYFYYSVDIEKLKKALHVFVGTHDFRSFCTGDEREDTVRTIDAVSVSFNRQLQAHVIEIIGKKFLHYMVRRIVGACLDAASRDFLSINCLREALAKKDPEQTLPNAPSKGLILHHIEYQK